MDKNYRTICIFSNYDESSIVQPYVFHLINRLNKDLNCSRFLFVSTSPDLSESDSECLKAIGVEPFIRENKGYDFGSYFYGLDVVGDSLESYDKVFFVNDSVYGPFNDIKPITQGFEKFDCWGLTDSWQYAYHLQSYFLCINKSAFSDLLEFKNNYDFPNEYTNIVLQGEIGLSQFFLAKGRSLCCAFPVEKLIGEKISASGQSIAGLSSRSAKRCMPYVFRKVVAVNPCSVFWKTLLQQGYPFLKKKHFIAQETFVQHFGVWLSEIDDEYRECARLMYSHVVSVRSANNNAGGKQPSKGITFWLGAENRHRRSIRAIAKAMRKIF